jgi:hypothetical protein
MINKQEALAALKEAQADAIKGMFNAFRINEGAERPDLAVRQEETGLQKLRDDGAKFAGLIESIFPE